MQILILGGDGMLGHRLLQDLGEGHDVVVTLRRGLEAYDRFKLFSEANAVGGVDVRDMPKLTDVLGATKPDVVINAVGIVKQRTASGDIEQSIAVNALFPHQLATLCRAHGARLIHISTDCVFKGDRGHYSEADTPDATDVYGRTKALGEVAGPGCVTLRTSIVGLELHRKASLVEWFLAQKGKVPGFTRAIFSGMTTHELSRVIRGIIDDHQGIDGIFHVASAAISKRDFLVGLAQVLERTDVEIIPSEALVCDRSLDGSAFRSLTGYGVRSWPDMLSELAGEIRARRDFQ